MVSRMEITYDETVDIIDIKYFVESTIGYTLPPGIYEVINLNLMLKPLLPNEVDVNNTIDDFRLWSNLAPNITIKLAKKPVLYTILCLTQSNSNHLNDPPEGYFQKTRRTYRIEKNPLTLPEMIKFIWNVIVIMEVL